MVQNDLTHIILLIQALSHHFIRRNDIVLDLRNSILTVVAQSMASACISSLMSAFLITALVPDPLIVEFFSKWN